MNEETLAGLLRDFRRSVAAARAVRVLLIGLFAGAFAWAIQLPDAQARQVLALLAIGGLVVWAAALTRAVRLGREIQAGSVLMAMGRLEDAEVCLGRVLGRFSLSSQAKFLVFQQLAALLFQQDQHKEVIAICRELLRHPVRRLHTIWLNTRLLLADSLLLRDQVAEAYAVIRPVYDVPLTLSDRMKLLPIQLRYELAADHAASAVQALAEKVHVAELLESQRAGLVHALLAEACRRQRMGAQHAFLAERARLYCDLEPLSARYPVITPITRETGARPSLGTVPESEQPSAGAEAGDS